MLHEVCKCYKALFGKNKLGPVYSQFIPNLFCDYSCQPENKLADLLLHNHPRFQASRQNIIKSFCYLEAF